MSNFVFRFDMHKKTRVTCDVLYLLWSFFFSSTNSISFFKFAIISLLYFLLNLILLIIYRFIWVCNSWLWVHTGGSDHMFLLFMFFYCKAGYSLGDMSFMFYKALWVDAKWSVIKEFFSVKQIAFCFIFWLF